MNETLLSFTLIFAELGGVLLLVMLAFVVRYILCAKKEVKITKELIKHIKSMFPKRRDKLAEFFEDKIDKNKADFNVDELLKTETKLYEHLVNVSMSKDTSLLRLTVNDINALLNDYVRMLTLKGHEVADADRDSRELTLRKENEALRLENASLLTRLTLSEETIENMMGEFSSMYEGGKKEGEQRLKNEMYQLKQSLDAEEIKVKSELTNIDESSEDS